MRFKYSLLIPTWNELAGLKEIWPKIDKSLFHQILVVDGNSNDGTIEFLKENSIEYIIQQEKGYAAAMNEGMAKVSGDVVVTFSPDGNSVPEKLPELISEMEKDKDMVIVSRYLGGHKSEDDDVVTAFGNWMFTTMINLFFGVKITDSLVIYRAYKMDVFRSFHIRNFGIYGMAGFETQITIECAMRGYQIDEIYGEEPPRIGGERKLRIFINGLGILLYTLLSGFLFRLGLLSSSYSKKLNAL